MGSGWVGRRKQARPPDRKRNHTQTDSGGCLWGRDYRINKQTTPVPPPGRWAHRPTQGCGWLIGICSVLVVTRPLAFGRLRIMAVFYADIGFLPRNKT